MSSSTSNLPIGVFDSGVGGLTVLKALADALPHENFLYLGDTARLPYGTKSPETIRKYSEQALKFLKAQGVKAVVIACNSASSQFREADYEGISVTNVIEPGARHALTVSRGHIGILGTHATVSSRVYENTILKLATAQNIQVHVTASAAPLFVPLAEEGWIDDPITNLVAYRYLQPLLQHQIDTLILGCTHYPILCASIARAAGSGVTLIDSGEAVARELKEKIKAQVIPARSSSNAEPRTLKLMSTDASANFMKISELLLEDHNFLTVHAADF